VAAQLGQWAVEGHKPRHLHRANSDAAGLYYVAAAGVGGLADAQNLIKEAAAVVGGSDLVWSQGETKR
jgi:hypothetical protein